MNRNWQLPGTVRDRQSISKDWQQYEQQLIEGVVVHEMKNVPTGYGYLTEIFRTDWGLDGAGVDQVFQSTLEPGGISAWHAHAVTTDRLFVSQGRVRIVLYDAREDSSTRGLLNQFCFGIVRPAIVVVPPRIWHGVQNASATPSALVNLVDRAYQYEQPDHYRLPMETDQIPYRFQGSARDALGRPERERGEP